MEFQEKPSLEELINELYHYGTPRRSGRYPWGSGDSPYQHSGDFLSRVEELRKSNYTYVDEDGKTLSGDNAIAKSMGLSSTQFRTSLGLAKDERRALNVATAERLRDKEGMTPTEIGKKMGVNESTVRSWFNEKSAFRMRQAQQTADFIRKQVDEKGMIDIGVGIERELNISKEKLKEALSILELEGYEIYGGRVPQLTNPSQKTTLKVICPPGTEHKDIYNYDEIHSLNEYISRDGGETYEKKFTYPESMDSRRLQIRYAEEGGSEKDGLVEIRRGVEDLSLGESRYAQVRILVDGNKYIKGMAVYSDNMPDGVDVIFNTNKKSNVSKLDVLKDIKNDPDNPFGSTIKDADKGGQYWYVDENGNKKLGLINKRSDEDDWSKWKDKLSAQFLSKQPISLAKRQLNLAIDDKVAEFNEICSLTNPTVKKTLLDTFANDCDSAAIHLYAAALPRQKYHVIIPITDMKDDEVYAPRYNDGEKVALIRYPHGGTFEIPILTVNNKQLSAKNLLGNAIDAVGINSKVAERLSGADFDGDTVIVIPTNSKVQIKSTPPLNGLIGFDPKTEYGTIKRDDGYYNAAGKKIKIMSNTQNEMGRISNLITDMTLQGAVNDELARAVRHSMVVIDAEKHKLDYKQSYIDNDIDGLKRKYQESGASTLLSRAKSETSVPKRQGTPIVNMKGNPSYDPSKPEGSLIYKVADDLYYPDRSFDKKTGKISIRTSAGQKITYDAKDKKAADKYEPVKKVNEKTGEVTYTNKKGDITYKTLVRTQKITQMAKTDDARTLISKADTEMERVYANFANKMKALANEARKEMKSTGKIEYSASAKNTYKAEVSSLLSKLNDALKNAPRERQAQVMANSIVEAKIKSNPGMKKDEIKKISQQELKRARESIGAKRTPVKVTDREWEAIQAGAISESQLKQILKNTDIDELRQRATPRSTSTISTVKASRMKAMSANGYTLNEIARALGVSPTTVSNYLKGKE